jgi:hypothetical protein
MFWVGVEYTLKCCDGVAVASGLQVCFSKQLVRIHEMRKLQQHVVKQRGGVIASACVEGAAGSIVGGVQRVHPRPFAV